MYWELMVFGKHELSNFDHLALVWPVFGTTPAALGGGATDGAGDDAGSALEDPARPLNHPGVDGAVALVEEAPLRSSGARRVEMSAGHGRRPAPSP